MTTAQGVLVGDLLWEGTSAPQEALWLAAELTEHLIHHGVFKHNGGRELEPYFLQQTVAGRVTTIPGARLMPVQISGPGSILASLLLGRPLDAYPQDAEQHAVWLHTIMADFRIKYHRHSAAWRTRVLVLLGTALAWEDVLHPSPVSFFRECILLAETADEMAPALPTSNTPAPHTRRWALGMS